MFKPLEPLRVFLLCVAFFLPGMGIYEYVAAVYTNYENPKKLSNETIHVVNFKRGSVEKQISSGRLSTGKTYQEPMYFLTYTLKNDSLEYHEQIRVDSAPAWMNKEPSQLIGTEQYHIVEIASQDKTWYVPKRAQQGLVIAFIFGLMGLPCLAYALYPSDKSKHIDIYMYSFPIFMLLGVFLFLY